MWGGDFSRGGGGGVYVWEGGKRRWMRATGSTSMLNADTQYLKDELRGGWEQNYFSVVSFLR